MAKFNQSALARQNQSRDERKPYMLYLDEFQNFITQILNTRTYLPCCAWQPKPTIHTPTLVRDIEQSGMGQITRLFMQNSLKMSWWSLPHYQLKQTLRLAM